MTDTAQTAQAEADRIAAFVGHVESIDAVDLDNVASGGIHARVVDFGFVSYVESFPDTTRATIDGSTITMGAHLQIHLNDGGVINMDVTVTGDDSDDVIGLRDIRPVEAVAA
jgi:hypothetical protein